MSEYNASAHIQIMQPAFAETQENSGMILLSPIAEQVGVDISGKMVTNLVKRKADVHVMITGALTHPEIRRKAEQSIIKDVLPKINTFLLDDTGLKIIKTMRGDASVPSKTTNEYQRYYEAGEYENFFVKAILYGFSRPNRLTSEEGMQEDDIYFLIEADYKCPMTGVRLWKKIKGQPVGKYRIIQIYPDDLEDDKKADFEKIKAVPLDFDDADNRIAVCPEYAEKYCIDPTPAEYKALVRRKAELTRKARARQSVESNPLEEEIAEVVKAIAEIDSMTELQPFTDALTLEDKIEKQNLVLLTALHDDVVQYYSFIANQFSMQESNAGASYKIIRSEITTCIEKFVQAQLTQEEICEEMCGWILENIGFGEKYKIAARIVVSFFVQNCAIFSPLNKENSLMEEE